MPYLRSKRSKLGLDPDFNGAQAALDIAERSDEEAVEKALQTITLPYKAKREAE